MKKIYVIEPSHTERQTLKTCIEKDKNEAYKIRHAHILLKADTKGSGWSDEKIVEAFDCHPQTVQNMRHRFVEEGFQRAIERGTAKAFNPL